MRVLSIIFIYFAFLFFFNSVSAGDAWTYYLDGNDIKALTAQGDNIYCATNGGLVIWNRHDKTYDQVIYSAETGCCQYQRTMFGAVAVDKNGIVWIPHGEGNNSELLSHDGEGWTVHTPENSGLPGRVLALCFDHNNVLWASMPVGIASFDGIAWKTYSEDGEGNALISVMAVDHDNVKWFRTEAGVSSFDGSVWITYTRENGLLDYAVNAMTVDADNVKWFALGNKTIASFDGNDWKTYEGIDWIPSSIAVDGTGTIWCGTNIGLFKFDGATWSRCTYENSGLPESVVRNVIVDDDGVLWAVFDSNRIIVDKTTLDTPRMFMGLKRFDGTTWSNWLIDGPLDYHVWCVAVDHDNVKWFGTPEKGLSRFDGKTWLTYTIADTTKLTFVNRIAVDKNNVKWMSYDSRYEDRINGKYTHWQVGGIMSFDGTTWTKYPEELTGLPSGKASDIFVGPDNIKWFTSSTGLVSYDDAKWVKYDYTRDDFGNLLGLLLAVDKDNVKWFSSFGGISSLDDTGWHYYKNPGVTNIFIDRENVKWIFGKSEIYTFDGSTWNTYDYEIPGTSVYLGRKMAEDSNGVKWFLSTEYNEFGPAGGGLTSYNGSTWTYHRDDFWLAYASDNLTIDLNNVKWLRSHSGIARYDGGPGDGTGPSEVHETTITPEALRIHANYPNPFNPATTITFSLPESGYTTLTIYNLTGQKVHDLMSGILSAGTHHITWNGCDDNGIPVSTGIYIPRLKMGKKTATGRMVLLR